MSYQIVVRFQFEGWHCWPNAPSPHEYLSHPHRHMFHVEAKKEVSHVDRDIEIIQLKRRIFNHCQEEWGPPEYGDLSDGVSCLSCEAMALELCKQFQLSSCMVLEDNENGGMYTTPVPDLWVPGDESEDTSHLSEDEKWHKAFNSNPKGNVSLKGSVTGRYTSSEPNFKEAPKRRFESKMFWGTEAEGPHRGIKTLFVPGDIPTSSAIDELNTLDNHQRWEYRNLYFGADNAYMSESLTIFYKKLLQRSAMIKSKISAIWVEAPYEWFLKERCKRPFENIFRVALLESQEHYDRIVDSDADMSNQCDFFKWIENGEIVWQDSNGDAFIFRTPLNDPLFALDTVAVFNDTEEDEEE